MWQRDFPHCTCANRSKCLLGQLAEASCKSIYCGTPVFRSKDQSNSEAKAATKSPRFSGSAVIIAGTRPLRFFFLPSFECYRRSVHHSRLVVSWLFLLRRESARTLIEPPIWLAQRLSLALYKPERPRGTRLTSTGRIAKFTRKTTPERTVGLGSP